MGVGILNARYLLLRILPRSETEGEPGDNHPRQRFTLSKYYHNHNEYVSSDVRVMCFRTHEFAVCPKKVDRPFSEMALRNMRGRPR